MPDPTQNMPLEQATPPEEQTVIPPREITTERQPQETSQEIVNPTFSAKPPEGSEAVPPVSTPPPPPEINQGAESSSIQPSSGSSLPDTAPSVIPALLQKAREKIQTRKRKRLEKIMELARAKGKITNNDVEKLLRVSDATATRFLRQLTSEGRLRRAGTTSTTYYKPTA